MQYAISVTVVRLSVCSQNRFSLVWPSLPLIMMSWAVRDWGDSDRVICFGKCGIMHLLHCKRPAERAAAICRGGM